MKYILSILLLVICILPISESVKAYVATDDELALLEATLSLEINRCEMQTNETVLQECDEKIMEYVNLLCLQYGTLESGKCDEAEQYLIERSR